MLLNSQAVALLQTIVRLIGPDYYLNPGSNQQGGGLSNGQYTRSQLEIYSIFEVRKVSEPALRIKCGSGPRIFFKIYQSSRSQSRLNQRFLFMILKSRKLVFRNLSGTKKYGSEPKESLFAFIQRHTLLLSLYIERFNSPK